MIEKFVPIEGYEGLYEVSNLGNVKSLNYGHTSKEKILSPGITKDGYLFVHLCKDGKIKNYFIHRLVAEAFIPNPFKLPCVNHKDENKLNNCVDNLEWCSRQYNVNYGTRNIRVSEKLSIPIYCVELDKIFQSSMEASRITGIFHGSINKCCKGTRKTAGKFHWRYL